MQMGERRDWQSVKLPRQAGQAEQHFPARVKDNVCTSRMGRVIALGHVPFLTLFCHFDVEYEKAKWIFHNVTIRVKLSFFFFF